MYITQNAYYCFIGNRCDYDRKKMIKQAIIKYRWKRDKKENKLLNMKEMKRYKKWVVKLKEE